jgi:hypothetical protein
MEAGGTDDKRMNILFADTLMLILEGVARTIELHQPLVENSYGLNNLVDLIEIVQVLFKKIFLK